jgi:hypothetical protein
MGLGRSIAGHFSERRGEEKRKQQKGKQIEMPYLRVTMHAENWAPRRYGFVNFVESPLPERGK